MLVKQIVRIIDQLSSGGAEKLHILSDFDRTLTQPFVNGEKVPSLISVLRDGDYLGSEYAKKAHDLFNTYHSIEIDPHISRDEKKKKMHEWWSRHFDLLIASGLTKNHIKRAMESRRAKLRDGAHEFFSLLKQNNIPLIIISSSGLGSESIQMFLEHE